MIGLFRTLAVAAVAATAFTGAAQAARVAVFADTTYVRYAPCGTEIWWCEASNLEATLKLYHHHVDTFTGITQGDFHSALEGKDALLIPDLTLSDLFSALSVGAQNEITNFVNGGGSLIFFYATPNSLALVNGLFGYSLANGPTATSYGLFGGSGTAFWGGPSSVPGNLSATNTLLFTTLPSGSTSIYYSGNGDAVSLIRQGGGYVIFMGWDWFDAPPAGTAAEGGWLDVLNAAVNQAVDPTKADVALLSDTTYVDYSLGANSEASNLQAAMLDRGNKVMPFDTITVTRFLDVLAGRDVLSIPEQQNGDVYAAMTASARDAVRDFVNGGGNLVVNGVFNGNGRTLINGLFGFSLAAVTGAPPYALDTAQAAGTPFAGGPSSLAGPSATIAVNLASLPPGTRAIYHTGSSVAVASIPVGCGTVTYLGWDWFSAAPEGTVDGGWNEVMNRGLGQEKRKFVANDFNGDGQGDILWRNSSTGTTIIWLMEGNVRVDSGSLGSIPNPPWEVAGTGDFNRDCKADVLWRNTSTGANILWQMDGLTTKAAGSITAVPPFWQVAGLRDYNGDLAVDILWRNSATGADIIWFMNGFTFTAASPGSVPTDWIVEE